MKIAIVDDRADDRALIRSQLEQELPDRGIFAELVEFESGESFAEAFLPGQFAVVFLDMYMGKMSGVEVGEMLYRQDPGCKIVLLTSSDEFLRESYAMAATYYLIKPYEPKRLRQALDFCFPAPAPEDILMVRTKKGMISIPRQQISFIEVVGRYPQIHLGDHLIESADSFADTVRPLEKDKRFFCCCRGVIVQLSHIKALVDNDFVMKNGHRAPISRRLKAQATQAFYSLMFAKAPWEVER